MADAIKKCRVKFVFNTDVAVDALYICGQSRNVGSWDAKDATPLRLGEEGWSCIKYLPVGETFEFKVLRDADWHGVEKGIWGEEIPNRAIVAVKGLVVRGTVPTFRQD